jgi:hypothetical protein
LGLRALHINEKAQPCTVPATEKWLEEETVTDERGMDSMVVSKELSGYFSNPTYCCATIMQGYKVSGIDHKPCELRAETPKE